MTIADGFPGQRMLVLPRPRLESALREPGTAHLVVTDCGYFPDAQSHGRNRRTPIAQAVVIVCVKGAGWCRTPNGTFPVSAGQVIILPPGRPHSYGADEGNPWTLWWLHVAGRDLPEFLTSAGMTTEAPVRNLSDVFRVVDLVAEVLRWMERDATTPSLLAAAGAAWHLMALLASDHTTTASTRSAVIDRAAAYLRSHLDERVRVPDLAAIAGLSPSHFSTLFRRQVGYPVLQYQTQIRMARARELLDTTDRSITQVGATVGYPDAFYFTRQFTRVHGVSPSLYRSQHKG